MQAIVLTHGTTLELQHLTRPEPRDDELLVDVRATGICGSDIHGLQGDVRVPPLIMGHEFSGITDDGRRVTVNPLLTCGHCDLCQRGLTNLCRDREIIGIHRPGGFAEAVAVPRSAIHDLDDDSDFMAGALVEPLANAVHALRIAPPVQGDRVAILGAGTIGIMVLLALGGLECEVTVADLSPHRRTLAEQLGADTTSGKLVGEYDLVFEAVGVGPTRRASLEHLRPGGTAVWIGLAHGDPGVDARHVVRGEQRVLGSYCYTGDDFRTALHTVGRLPLDWVTLSPLSQGVTVFEALLGGETTDTKAILTVP